MAVLFTVIALLVLTFLIWLFLKKKKNKQQQQQQQQSQKQPQASPNNQEDEKEAKPQPQQPQQPQPQPAKPTSIPSPKKGIPVRVSGIVSGDGGNKPSSSGVIQSSGEVKRNFIRPRDLK